MAEPIFQNAGQSKQLITANDFQNWSVALGAKADSVPKTEHKPKESGIIASRHRKLSRTSLRLGNLLRKKVVIGKTVAVPSLRTQENFRFPDDY
jgi:hypothetical protein